MVFVETSEKIEFECSLSTKVNTLLFLATVLNDLHTFTSLQAVWSATLTWIYSLQSLKVIFSAAEALVSLKIQQSKWEIGRQLKSIQTLFHVIYSWRSVRGFRNKIVFILKMNFMKRCLRGAIPHTKTRYENLCLFGYQNECWIEKFHWCAFSL